MLTAIRRFYNGVLNKAERHRRTRLSSGPTSAIIHVSDKCTFRCAMCMNADQPVQWPAEGVHGRSGEFRLADLQRLVSTWPELRSVCFAGVGEPLLAEDIRAMVDYAHEAGLETEIVTNGTLVGQHLDWLTAGSLDRVSVSLNAWDADSARRYCGVNGDVLERVRESVGRLVERSNGAGPAIEMSSVLWKGRKSEALDLVSFAARTGVKQISFHNLIPSSLENCGVDEVLGPDDAEWLDDLVQAGEKLGVAVSKPTLFDASTPARGCESPWRVLYVDASGAVSGCFRVEAPSLAHGDWRDRECWNGEYYRSLRASHMSRGADGTLPERCERCVEVHGVAE